jgi:predicted RNA binding protein YcfA (HicA-like mRNA interferase family)
MKHYTKLPAIGGKNLINLLQKDGWVQGRMATHGVSLTKAFRDRIRVTIIPTSNVALDNGTLSAILGLKQTCIGKSGLLELVNKYGL